MRDKTIGNLYVFGQFALLIGLLLTPAGNTWPSGYFSFITSTVLLVAGLAVLVLAGLTLGKSLSANPVPLAKSTLKTNGIYAVVRHPIYFGLTLASLGLAISSHNWLGLALFGALVTLLNFKARFEEKLLRAKFDNYSDYARKVGRFIPFIGRSK